MKSLKRVLSLILVVALLACYVVPGVNAETTEVENSTNVELKLVAGKYDENEDFVSLGESEVLKPGDTVVIQLSLSGNSQDNNITNVQALINYNCDLVEYKSYWKNTELDGSAECSNVTSNVVALGWLNQNGFGKSGKTAFTVWQSGCIAELTFQVRSDAQMGQLSFSLLTEEIEATDGNKKLQMVAVGNDSISYKTVDATAMIVVPNSLVINGVSEFDPLPNDSSALGADLTHAEMYTATYYDAVGSAVSNAEVTWSLEGVAGAAGSPTIDSNGNLVIKTAENFYSASYTLKAALKNDSNITASKTVTAQKSNDKWNKLLNYTVKMTGEGVEKSLDQNTTSAQTWDVTSGGNDLSLNFTLENPMDAYGETQNGLFSIALEGFDNGKYPTTDSNVLKISAGTENSGTVQFLYAGTVFQSVTLNITKEAPVATSIQFYMQADDASETEAAMPVKGDTISLPIPARANNEGYLSGQSYGVKIYAVVLDQYGVVLEPSSKIKPTYGTLPNGCTISQDNDTNVLRLNLSNVIENAETLQLSVQQGEVKSVNGALAINFYDITYSGAGNFKSSVETTAVYGKQWNELVNIRGVDFGPMLNGISLTNNAYSVCYKSDNSSWQYQMDTVPDVGTYKWYVQYKNTDYSGKWANFIAASGMITITAADITQNITVTLDQASYPYTGAQIMPGVTVTKNGTTLTKDTDYSVEYGTNIGVGTDVGTVTVKSRSGANEAFEVTEKFSITAKDLTNEADVTVELSGVPENGYTYTPSTEHKPTVTVNKGETPLTADTDYTLSYSRNNSATDDFTSAGTITVTVTFCGNYTGTKTASYVINKAEQSTLSIEIKDNGHTANILYYSYDYSLSTNGGSGEGTVSYEIVAQNSNTGAATISDTTLTATGIGYITIKATKAADGNYQTATAEKCVQINALKWGIPNGIYTYDGTQKRLCSVLENMSTTDETVATNAGTYPVVLKLKNYPNEEWGTANFSGENSSEFTINGDSVTISYVIKKSDARNLSGQTKDLLYSNTDLQEFSASTIAELLRALDNNAGTTAKITGVSVSENNILSAAPVKANDGSKITYSLKSGLDKTDAEKTATITINYESNNYENGTIELKVNVVDKNQATVTFGDAESRTYTGSAQKPNAPTVTLTSGTADTGNISYTVKKDGNDFAAGFEGMVDAGTYTITATYEDDSNYGTASTTFTINPAGLTVSGGTATKVYDGAPQATGIAGETLTCTTVTNTGLTKGTDYTISNVAFDDANAGTGKTVTYKVQLNGTAEAKNYTLKDETEGVLTVTTTGTITPKAVTVTVNAIADQTYNHGAAIKPAVSVTATELVGSDTLTAGTDYTVSYSSNTTVGTAAVTIGSVTGSNYAVTGTGSFTIKEYAVALPTVKTEALTFNGEVQTGIDASKDSAYYTITGDTATNAGTHTATVELKDKVNYVWDVTPATKENQTIKWNIAQATAPDSLKDVAKSYKYSLTGAQTAQISGVPADAGTVTYAVTDFVSNDYVESVGVSNTGLVSFTLKGQRAYDETAKAEIHVEVTMTNYATKTVKVVITFTDKDTPTVKVQNITKTYDGKTLTNSDIRGTASVAGNWSFVTDVSGMVNAATYKNVAVKFVPTDSVNYSEVETTITVTINKATPTITVETETEDGKLMVKADKDAETFGEVLTADDFDVEGVLTWTGKNSDGEDVEINGDTKLEDVDLDSVTWTFTPNDTTNYEPVTGGISQETSSNWWIIGAIAGGSGKSSTLDDFTDLDKDAWYAEAVEYCLDEGLMSGTGNGKFSPNGGMTRAMVWTVLGRLSGETFNGTGTNWYLDAQKWAIRAGVSDGTNPNGQITREELVTMLWRFAGSPKADVSALRWYNDGASVSDWAREAMAWAVNCSLVEGSNWNLTPGAVATRCQVAAIFMRYHKN